MARTRRRVSAQAATEPTDPTRCAGARDARGAGTSPEAREHLAPGGWLAVEHGYDQSDAVQALFRDAGFADVVTLRDLAGIPRVVAGQ